MDSNLSLSDLSFSNNSYTLPPFENLTIEPLDVLQCFLTDFPDYRNFDCSQRQPDVCVKCKKSGGYLFPGDILAPEKSVGNFICRIILVLCGVVGTVGIFTNALIMVVIHKRHTSRAFDFLLLNLAFVDILCCLSSLSIGAARVVFYGKL